MTLSELARASGLPKSTVHRLLARLVDLGALEHHRSGYKLGLGLLQLGATTPAANMRDLGIPFLVALQRWSGLTVTCAVLRDFDTVFIERLAPLDETFQLARVGARLPANCTAIGKALLAQEDLDDLAAFLPDRLPQLTPYSITDSAEFVEHLRIVVKEGVAREYGEAQLDLESIGMPVVVNGLAVGAVAVSGPSHQPLGSRVEEALRTTVRQIAARGAEYVARDRSRERLMPRTITDPAPWSVS
jgi:DNA-binding IclR family transcriptional regulator